MSEEHIETCSRHGLRFDPRTQSGCVICRRELGEGIDPGEGFNVLRAVWFGLAVLGIAVCVLVFVRQRRPPERSAGVSAAAQGCVDHAAEDALRCTSRCPGAAAELCRSDCLVRLHEVVNRCPGIAAIQTGELQLLAATGEAPAWALVKPSFEVALNGLKNCVDTRGPFTAKFQTDASGKTMDVAAGAAHSDAIECVAAQLAKVDLQAQHPHAYTLLLRGWGPTTQVLQPTARAPDAGRPPPTQLDNWYKEQEAARAANAAKLAGDKQHDHSKDPPRVMLPLDDDRMSQVRAQLREARRLCAAQDGEGCARAVHPLRDVFAVLPLNHVFGAHPIAPYVLNTLGAGFDCVSVDKASYASNTSLIVARAGAHPSSWSFFEDKSTGGFYWDMHASNEPWPAGYAGGAVRMMNLPPRPMLVCLDFEKPTNETVYIGMTTYSGANDGNTNSDLLAQGLVPEGLEGTNLCEDLKQGRVDAIKKKLAAGLDINQTESLVCAIYGRWPLEEIDVLLRAGANPNAIPWGSEEGPLYYAVKRTYHDPDAKVAEAVKKLLAAGAKPNFVNMQGRTPMHYAADARFPLTWKAMLQGGGNPNLRDDDGETPEQRYAQTVRMYVK